MGNRLSKIYTRTGDTGTTGLAGNERIDKDAPRVEAMGSIDELNSAIGIMLVHQMPDEAMAALNEIQHKLFDLGGELAMPEYQTIVAEDISFLETTLDSYNETLPPLKEFILPGGTVLAAHTHLARAICRRAERCLVPLVRDENVRTELMAYVNRLSDLLFVFGRVFARMENGSEVFWRHDR
jgi:cob(I)alamin adenosyltransferase